MPKQKITKQMVVNAAFELARAGGMEQVKVKNIAEKLGCSVQPVYSYCQNMKGLRSDVAMQAKSFIQKYIAKHINPNDLFCSTGQAYVRIAKEEPHLFRIFVFQERSSISSLDEFYKAETSPQMAGVIADALDISIENAQLLHLNMLIYTIGIGTILSVTSPGISTEEIYFKQEQAYQAFLKDAQSKEATNQP